MRSTRYFSLSAGERHVRSNPRAAPHHAVYGHAQGDVNFFVKTWGCV